MDLENCTIDSPWATNIDNKVWKETRKRMRRRMFFVWGEETRDMFSRQYASQAQRRMPKSPHNAENGGLFSEERQLASPKSAEALSPFGFHLQWRGPRYMGGGGGDPSKASNEPPDLPRGFCSVHTPLSFHFRFSWVVLVPSGALFRKIFQKYHQRLGSAAIEFALNMCLQRKAEDGLSSEPAAVTRFHRCHSHESRVNAPAEALAVIWFSWGGANKGEKKKKSLPKVRLCHGNVGRRKDCCDISKILAFYLLFQSFQKECTGAIPVQWHTWWSWWVGARKAMCFFEIQNPFGERCT